MSSFGLLDILTVACNLDMGRPASACRAESRSGSAAPTPSKLRCVGSFTHSDHLAMGYDKCDEYDEYEHEYEYEDEDDDDDDDHDDDNDDDVSCD